MSNIDMSSIPLWVCLPFAALLICIAVMPLVAGEWWEKRQPFVIILLSVLFIIPFAVLYGTGAAAETVLECLFNDYLTFIVLLFGLYCVAGNIHLDGDLAGSPRINILMLLMGTVLASFIGTTGASMLLVRPVIKMNAWRRNRAHIMVFFIFLVSNIGGCLTPIGDPPLLMGFSRGVPFAWSFHLLPLLAVNTVLLLLIFCVIDRRAYRRDIVAGMRPDISGRGTRISLKGVHNFIFIGMIIFAVIRGVLPKLPAFQNADGETIGIHIFGEVSFPVSSLIEVIIILLAAFLSFRTTKKNVRLANHFTWGAIREVAVLFVGIFITMQPALMILEAKGGSLGLTQPFQMFWVTGALSSFLDNTPTYLVFLTTAGAMDFGSGIATTVGMIPVKMLMAVSAGAVFMGANTYIGNAPNFMVKSISEENGIRMPSFVGYLSWSVRFLIPVFFIDMLLFFL
ncbi:MAG: sodium:proton antiporter [Lachnospiraceae bacterium]|nr:sodium:proton antiporter [Lachnospiraceae bacterium]